MSGGRHASWASAMRQMAAQPAGAHGSGVQRPGWRSLVRSIDQCHLNWVCTECAQRSRQGPDPSVWSGDALQQVWKDRVFIYGRGVPTKSKSRCRRSPPAPRPRLPARRTRTRAARAVDIDSRRDRPRTPSRSRVMPPPGSPESAPVKLFQIKNLQSFPPLPKKSGKVSRLWQGRGKRGRSPFPASRKGRGLLHTKWTEKCVAWPARGVSCNKRETRSSNRGCCRAVGGAQLECRAGCDPSAMCPRRWHAAGPGFTLPLTCLRAIVTVVSTRTEH